MTHRLCAFIAAFLVSCGQDYNSNSGDDKLAPARAHSLDCATAATKRFCTARAILQKRCFSCHTEWLPHQSEAAWLSSGLIIARDSKGSRLIARLINSGSDMPRDGSALPGDEFQALKTWIDQLALNLGERSP